MRAAKTDLPAQADKGLLNDTLGQPGACRAHEQVVGNSLIMPVTPAALDIVSQNLTTRFMQGDQPGSPVFFRVYCQQCIFKVHVLEFQVACFCESQSGDAEQADQAVIGTRLQCALSVSTRHLAGRLQQRVDFLSAVQVRLDGFAPSRKDAWLGNFSTRIIRLAIPGKPAYQRHAFSAVA